MRATSRPARSFTRWANDRRRHGLVLEGTIEVARRDGLDHEAPITIHGVGQISGEVSQLAGRPRWPPAAPVSGLQRSSFDAAHLRALVIGSADVGEVIMRAFILRRVGLIQEGGAGSVLVGRPDDAGARAAAGLPRPQRLSLRGARRCGRRGWARVRGAFGRARRTNCH